MRRIVQAVLKFAMAFFVMTIVCSIAWEKFVDEKLYDATDGVPFGYLTPGFWIGGDWPVRVVPQIVPGNMNDPDSIKEGWTIGRLLELWFFFFATSVVVSMTLARMPWPRIGYRPRKEVRDAG
jgi:hypothetical protein